MALRMPPPPRRNPFKAGSVMAGQFDTTVHAHLSKHRDLARGRGNLLASMFWKGYDGKLALVDRQSLAWAAYRAGQFCRRLEQ
jgi:hypothetical protein